MLQTFNLFTATSIPYESTCPRTPKSNNQHTPTRDPNIASKNTRAGTQLHFSESHRKIPSVPTTHRFHQERAQKMPCLPTAKAHLSQSQFLSPFPSTGHLLLGRGISGEEVANRSRDHAGRRVSEWELAFIEKDGSVKIPKRHIWAITSRRTETREEVVCQFCRGVEECWISGPHT